MIKYYLKETFARQTAGRRSTLRKRHPLKHVTTPEQMPRKNYLINLPRRPLYMKYGMQKNKTNILSTRPLNKQLIDEAARHNIIIDEISFIETKLITDKKSGAAIERYSQQPITAIFTSM